MGHSLNINGVKYDKTNLPSDFSIQDVKSKKMQKVLNLFDYDGDGNIFGDEAQQVSLFYQTGCATILEDDGKETTEYTIYTRKPGKNPKVVITERMDNETESLLYAEYSAYNRRMNLSRSDQYRLTHNQDGSVGVLHDIINSKGRLVKTEEGTISEDGAYEKKRTIGYSRGKTPGEVNAKYTKAEGTTKISTYRSF